MIGGKQDDTPDMSLEELRAAFRSATKKEPKWLSGFCQRAVATVALVLIGGGLLVVLGVMWRLIRWGFGF